MTRHISTILSLLAFVLGLGLSATPASAQDNPGQYAILVPERLERATVEDENGKLQWAELKTVLNEMDQEERQLRRCPTCEGKKKQPCPFCWRLEFHEECPECHTGPEADDKEKLATCRTCSGEGVIPDILERAPCPGCAGAGISRCQICGGEGNYGTTATDRRSKCPGCKGAGFFACGVCRSSGHVETPKLKDGVAEAELEDLEEALESLEEVAAELAKFESAGDTRDDRKAWTAILKPGLKVFPPLKRLARDVGESTKAHARGSIFTQGKEMAANHTRDRKAALDTYLRTERRLLQLCIARQKHNAEVEAKAEGGGR